MYDHVLVPTDRSDGAKRALDKALDLAEQNDATLHVIYVLDEGVYGETPALSPDELYLDEFVDDVEAMLNEVSERAAERDVETETHTFRGTPYEEIVTYAEDRDVDVVVMGRHGIGDHGQPHLGSVTDRVIRETTLPVLTV